MKKRIIRFCIEKFLGRILKHFNYEVWARGTRDGRCVVYYRKCGGEVYLVGTVSDDPIGGLIDHLRMQKI